MNKILITILEKDRKLFQGYCCKLEGGASLVHFGVVPPVYPAAAHREGDVGCGVIGGDGSHQYVGSKEVVVCVRIKVVDKLLKRRRGVKSPWRQCGLHPH